MRASGPAPGRHGGLPHLGLESTLMPPRWMMQRSEMLGWLRETDERRLESLWARADAVRRENVGDAVHLRGLIEVSNHCVRRCAYCGLRAENTRLERYRLTADEVVACARQAAQLGYGTVVLQAGEDPALTVDWVADLVQRIKAETGLAVTLSLGEQDEATLRSWRDAGADRYLLRFETSNRALFDRIHPSRPGRRSDRLALLRVLRDLDYEVGSGVMVGVPGQTYDDLANDIELFRDLDLDMIGVGPWLPHPDTPLGAGIEGKGTEGTAIAGLRGVGGDELASVPPLPSREGLGEGRDSHPHPTSPWKGEAWQVLNTELMTYKVVALARLVCPRANIPSTTALATLNRDSGRELGLQRGANVVMPNLTPPAYRRLYEIYPAKACLFETAEQCHGCLTGRIRHIGRVIATGPGGSPNWIARRAAKSTGVAPDDGVPSGVPRPQVDTDNP